MPGQTRSTSNSIATDQPRETRLVNERADGGDDVDDRRVYLPPAASPWNLAHYHTKASCAARGFGGPVREVFLETAVKEGHSACGICANGVEFVEGGVKA